MSHHETFGRGKGFTAKNPQPPNDLISTPIKIAKLIISLYDIPHNNSILDPCKGGGSFYDNYPIANKKYWCEINEGKDFLIYENKVDWIITNPPYSILDDFLNKSFQISDNIVFLLPLSKMFSSLGRIRRILGFGNIVSIHIIGAGKCGFPFGFPACAFHIRKGYDGETLIKELIE
jgi:type I restriction-modification system DNA methylase subunit